MEYLTVNPKIASAHFDYVGDPYRGESVRVTGRSLSDCYRRLTWLRYPYPTYAAITMAWAHTITVKSIIPAHLDYKDKPVFTRYIKYIVEGKKMDITIRVGVLITGAIMMSVQQVFKVQDWKDYVSVEDLAASPVFMPEIKTIAGISTWSVYCALLELIAPGKNHEISEQLGEASSKICHDLEEPL